MKAARNANPKGLKGSPWKTPTGKEPKRNPNDHPQYDFKPVFGREQHFEDWDARRASKDMRR